VNTETLLNELNLLVGSDHLHLHTSTSEIALPPSWSTPPLAVILPGAVDEVVSVVRATEEAGVALLPCGGATQLHTGFPPRPDTPYLLLRTTRLNRILAYEPDDLTVTCEPGVTLAQLQNALSEHRQQVALDVALLELATLGGIVSTNASGFWRPTYGTPRDLLIGVHAVMTGGERVKGGGRVVKNVAGYDLCKLFTGAWGTLGILTELTFKVRPQPETSRTLVWEAPDLTTAARIGLSLHHTRLAAAFVLATNEHRGQPELILGLQGTEARVAWQAEEFSRLSREAGLSGSPADLPESELNALLNRQARTESDALLAARVACLPTELPDFLTRLDALPPLAMTAHCATGVLSLAANESDPALVHLIDALKPKGANRVWTRIEAELVERDNIALWGEAREDFALQRGIKQALDPKGTFSPGRFFGKL